MTVLDAVVIGAGQAGLAASYSLSQRKMRFRVLESRAHPGGSWPRYYKSLQLFSPARHSSLPGLPFPGDPGRYPLRDEVTAYLRRYAEHFGFPIQTSTKIASVTRDEDSFVTRDEHGRRWRSRAVIVATGPYTHPRIPPLPGLEVFNGRVLHSAEYRRPEPLAGRRVVIVGSRNSAVQIGAELASVARVTIASREPIDFRSQRILGRDIHFWTQLMGTDRLRWFARLPTPVIDDGRYRAAIASGTPDRRPMFEQLTPAGVVWSDGCEEPVDVLLLATGFVERFPMLDRMPGSCEHRRGVSRHVPGLYFVGRPAQSGFASATLRGVGRDAKYVVAKAEQLLTRKPTALGRALEVGFATSMSYRN